MNGAIKNPITVIIVSVCDTKQSFIYTAKEQVVVNIDGDDGDHGYDSVETSAVQL